VRKGVVGDQAHAKSVNRALTLFDAIQVRSRLGDKVSRHVSKHTAACF